MVMLILFLILFLVAFAPPMILFILFYFPLALILALTKPRR